MKTNVILKTQLGVLVNNYRVLIDDEVWCETNDDHEGLKLMVAINKLKAKWMEQLRAEVIT